jgi:DNA-binding IclR family transcriptional regulator
LKKENANVHGPGGRTMIFRNFKELAKNALILNHYNLSLAAADIGVSYNTLLQILDDATPTAQTIHKLLVYASTLSLLNQEQLILCHTKDKVNHRQAI